MVLKKFTFLLSFLLLFTGGYASSTPEALKNRADSLFKERKYTSAFQVYKSILDDKKATEDMLVKMAFIKEGLREYPSALYYLSLTNRLQPDKAVMKKMKQLGSQQKLSGYDVKGFDWFLYYYFHWRNTVLAVLLGVAMLTAVVMAARWYKGKAPGVIRGTILMALLGGVFFLLNQQFYPRHGVIRSGKTYLMKGPSAASGVHRIIGAGHRVKVLQDREAWYKIRINKETAFLRKGDLRMIRL